MTPPSPSREMPKRAKAQYSSNNSNRREDRMASPSPLVSDPLDVSLGLGLPGAESRGFRYASRIKPGAP